MNKIIIKTDNAPAPIGPYNQAVQYGDIVFISGQVPIVPNTMELVTSSIQDETHQVMKNLDAILKEAKLTFSNVLKATIFLSSMDHFGEVNEVYGAYFSSDFPARETVAVKTLPKNVNVEISLIAGK